MSDYKLFTLFVNINEYKDFKIDKNIDFNLNLKQENIKTNYIKQASNWEAGL